MYILLADSVSYSVVPYRKHSPQQIRISFFYFKPIIHLLRSPFIVQPSCIQIIMIIVDTGYNIKIGITGINHFISLFQCRLKIQPPIIPRIYITAFYIYRCSSLHLFQTSPQTGSLAKTSNVFQIIICKVTELLHFFDVVFIGTDMYIRTGKNRIITPNIFGKQGIEKSIYLRLIQIQMVHAVLLLLGCQSRVIMRKRQRMGRYIDFRYYFNAITVCQFLKLLEFCLSIRTIFCCQPWKTVAFQTKSGISLVPVIIEKLHKSIVIQMNLKLIHFIE